MIAHSDGFKETFAHFVAQMPPAVLGSPLGRAALRDLHSAKHRFDSMSVPMGRVVLLIHPLIQTMQHIASTASRRGPAQQADDFLAFIDNERILTLAMLADAGDETIRLKNLYDSAGFDPSAHRRSVVEFRSRIQFLFVDGHCLSLGYTAETLRTLERGHAFHLKGGTVRSIGGGVTEAIKSRCLQRLRRWVWLAGASLQVECPSWDFLSLFSIFDLDSFRAGSTSGPSAMAGAMARPVPEISVFDRAARVFSVDVAELRREWTEVLPLAWKTRASAEGKISNAVCFQQAVQEFLSRSTCRGQYRTGALQAVLAAFVACHGLSTSEVERGHAVIRRCNLHKTQDVARENDELFVRSVLEDERPAIVRCAQKIWTQLYGRTRKHCKRRRDKGQQRPKPSQQARPRTRV